MESRQARALRGFRGVSAGFAVVGVALTVYIAAGASLSSSWTPPKVVAVMLLAILGALFAVGAVVATSPPAYVEVDEQGVRLEEITGRVTEFSWGNPRFKLLLFRTTGAPDRVSRGLPKQSVSRIVNVLTPEAFECVLSTAVGQGLKVQTSVETGRPGWTRYRITRG